MIDTDSRRKFGTVSSSFAENQRLSTVGNSLEAR